MGCEELGISKAGKMGRKRNSWEMILFDEMKSFWIMSHSVPGLFMLGTALVHRRRCPESGEADEHTHNTWARGNHFHKKSHGAQKECLMPIRKIREDSLGEVTFVEQTRFQQVEGGKK